MRFKREILVNRVVMRTATSCEPLHSTAYSDDLCWKVVWQWEALTLSCEVVARNLCIDSSTVHRIIQRFRITDDISKWLHHSESNKLSDSVQIFILNLIVCSPGIYRREIHKELRDFFDIDVEKSTIWKFLHENGITKQNMRITTLQRDDFYDKNISMMYLYCDSVMIIKIREVRPTRTHGIN